MRSFVLTALLAASSFLLASAQIYPPFNVSSVPEGDRKQWCVSQTTACPLLCQDTGKSATKNSCFPDNLYFICLCSDGITPNLTQYSQTIPYFRCREEVRLCVEACTGDSKCQTACVENRPCGATDPTRTNSTSTSSTKTSTKTGTATTGVSNPDGTGFGVTGSPDSQNSGTNSGAGSLFLEAGNAYGLGLFVVSIAVGAAMIGA